MDATTTPPTSSLPERLKKDFPAFAFHDGEEFEWQPTSQTIVYNSSDLWFEPRLLHELAHAVLGHSDYEKDIDLIALERDAWQLAKVDLATRYDVRVPADIVHQDMDTYRDWLHARSMCPKCSANGLETTRRTYRCLACSHVWRVNEARICALRRYSLPT